MHRKRYMISWRFEDITGRDHWIMERKGKLSSSDIKRLELILAEKWELPMPVTITNFVLIN